MRYLVVGPPAAKDLVSFAVGDYAGSAYGFSKIPIFQKVYDAYSPQGVRS